MFYAIKPRKLCLMVKFTQFNVMVSYHKIQVVVNIIVKNTQNDINAYVVCKNFNEDLSLEVVLLSMTKIRNMLFVLNISIENMTIP